MSKRRIASSDIESLKAEALKYSSRTEFFKKSRSAYKMCLKLDVMDIVCVHMIKHNALNGQHGNCTMSNEDLFELAKPFIQRSHFKERHPTAYRAARERGLIDQVCSHMIPAGNKFNRKIYAFEHSDNSVYVGLSYNPEKRKGSHLRSNKTIIEKSKNTIQVFKLLTDWLSPKDAQKMERHYVEEYLRSGWIILNKARTGGLGGNFQAFTKEKCHEISLECTTRVEFVKKNVSAYQAARRNKWLDEICSHMIPNRTKPWTFEELLGMALACKTKYDFKKKHGGAYKAARERGILDKICSHMPKDCRILSRKDRPK